VELQQVKTIMRRNDGTTVFVRVSRFPRKHRVFGSAAGWCCLSAADSRTEGEDDWLKAKGVREKPVPMPLYPPQIPHRLA